MEDSDYYSRYINRTKDKINIIIKNIEIFNVNFLEIGCNSGQLSREILKYNPLFILGIEMSEDTIDEELKKNSLFDYWTGDLIKFPFKKKFHTTFCLSVLHHILGKYGWEEFSRVFNSILSSTNVLFFEIGQPEEKGDFYWKDRILERFEWDISFLNWVLSNDKIKKCKIIGRLPIHDSYRYIFKIYTK